METIRNPFAGGPGYDCFGCSPSNPVGLGLRFRDDGDGIVTEWKAGEHHVGFDGVLHGGIQATLHDEIASWFVFAKLGTAGFTSELSVRYLSPVYVAKGAVRLRCTLLTQDGRKATMRCLLYDGTGKLCSESDVTYSTVPEHIARRMFKYPGKEAFGTEPGAGAEGT